MLPFKIIVKYFLIKILYERIMKRPFSEFMARLAMDEKGITSWQRLAASLTVLRV